MLTMCNISKQQQKKLNIENIKDLTRCLMSLSLFHIPDCLERVIYFECLTKLRVLFINHESVEWLRYYSLNDCNLYFDYAFFKIITEETSRCKIIFTWTGSTHVATLTQQERPKVPFTYNVYFSNWLLSSISVLWVHYGLEQPFRSGHIGCEVV